MAFGCTRDLDEYDDNTCYECDVEHPIGIACTHQELLKGKWMLDGVETLIEAAERLEGIARYLREQDAAGRKLVGKIEDDYGYIDGTRVEASEAQSDLAGEC